MGPLSGHLGPMKGRREKSRRVLRISWVKRRTNEDIRKEINVTTGRFLRQEKETTIFRLCNKGRRKKSS